MSQEPKKQTRKKSATKSNKPKTWLKRLYIPGFGFVNQGEEASSDALLAWKKWTNGADPKVDQSKYLG